MNLEPFGVSISIDDCQGKIKKVHIGTTTIPVTLVWKEISSSFILTAH